MNSVLVVAAHPDDEVLGCGATIARHVARGDEVHVLIIAQGAMGRPGATESDLQALRTAAGAAGEVLGVRTLTLLDYPDHQLEGVAAPEITALVESHIEKRSANVVYTHYRGDLNRDHTRVSECTVAACRPLPGRNVDTVLFFEVPSSTEWGFAQAGFTPNWFHDVAETLPAKLEALRAYQSELRPFPHPRSEEAIVHLARWRGATVGVYAAEAFVLGRAIER